MGHFEADVDVREPVVEVLPEAARTDLGRQIAIRASDDAHVRVLDASGADRLDLASLERSQQLRLDRRRKLPHFVEHQGATVRLRKESTPRMGCTGECALRVPEEL